MAHSLFKGPDRSAHINGLYSISDPDSVLPLTEEGGSEISDNL
jgi:hypothetical protein